MAVNLATDLAQFTLVGASINNPTSLQFGPDGRLYVAQQDGLLKIFSVERTATAYQVTSSETISLVQALPNHNDDGSFAPTITTRQVTGLFVGGTAAAPVIYVGSSDPRIAVGVDSNLDTNSGILSRLSLGAGGAWEKIDLVRGLPRSEENHSINGLQYDAATNTLLVAVGGNTNMGSPSNNFGYLPEYAYSAAILKVDLTAIEQMTVKVDTSSGIAQNYKYDLPTLNDPTRADATETVFGGNDGLNMAKIAADSPVQIYSPGYRNPYDMVMTQGGKLYVMDNGPNKGWGGVPVSINGVITNQANTNNGISSSDTLHLVTGEGYYGGHPNAVRASGGAAGLPESDGDNTDGYVDGVLRPASDLPVDFNEVVFATNPKEAIYKHPGGDAPALWTNGQSTNGIAEYTASTFGGALKGDLLTVGYGGSLYRLDLTDDGSTVQNVTSLSIGGTPLDVIAQGDGAPFAGTIWVAKYGADSISILEPSTTSTTPVTNDDDRDGILNAIDRFGLDASNGLGTPILAGATLNWSLSAADPATPGPGDSLFGLGFTGLMVDWNTPYSGLYDIENITPGGAAGVVTVDEVGGGTATGALNNQREAFQFGVSPDAGTRLFTVTTQMDNPFDTIAVPTDDQSQGFYIGTGDQDNFLEIAVHANGGAGGIEVLYEEGGVPTSIFYAAPGLIAAGETDTVTLSFDVNVAQALATPVWSYTTGDGAQVVNGSGDAVHLTGNVLAALQGWYMVDSRASGLAVGLIATSRGEGAPFTALWDSVRITAPANTFVASSVADLALVPGTNGKEIIVYGGSESIGTLPDLIDDVNLSGNPYDVSVTGNALDNVLDAGAGINILRGGAGADSFNGTAATLNGDTIGDFFVQDRIVINGVGGAAAIRGFDRATGLLSFDADGDGTAETVIHLAGSAFTQGTSLADFTTTVGGGTATIAYTPAAGALVAAINVGGSAYYDADSGITYQADTGQYVAAGSTKYATTTAILGTNDMSLYNNHRYSTGNLTYNIPVAPGDYIVTLKFAEVYNGVTGPGQRVFDVTGEGNMLIDNLDIYGRVGGFTAYDWTGAVQVDDGYLTLDFLKGAAQNPEVSAILVQSAGSVVPPGSATMTINPAGVIDASTYTAGKAFSITNTGQKDIASITFDLGTTHLKNILFDPAGTAGDLTAKNLTIDSAGGTGAVQPASKDYSIFAGGRAGGYEKMTISFNAAVAGGFNGGETVKFSIDIDPTSIKNSGVDGDAGSISGAELTGATVTVTYADGSTQRSAIFGDGSQGGGKASWSETEPAAPVLSVGGLSSGAVAVTVQTQTVIVTGAANATVKVMVTTGGMGNNVQPVDIFDANKAIAIDYRTVVLDAGGHGSFQLDLPAQNPVYLSAAVDQAGATGAVSAGLVLAWDTDTRSYVGTNGADTFTGAAAHSWIVSGLNGNDILTTAEKDDKVDGGGGNDTIATRAGDDVITYSGTATGNDIIDGGDGFDRIEALANNSVIGLAAVTNVEAITAGGWTGVRIVGTSNADTFDFSAVTLTGISLIDLGKGNDVFVGSTADDVVAGGEGNDSLHGGLGDDIFQVAGSTGTDLYYGDGGYDRIVAVAANASINALGLNGIEEISGGGFANVTLMGSGGADILDLQTVQLVGIAAINAGNGNDTVNGSASGDVIVGGGGNDTLQGRGGDDTFQIGTGAGTDLIDGGDGFDRIVAVAANAVIGLSYVDGIEEITANSFAGVRIVGSGSADTFDFGNVNLVGIVSIDGGSGNDVLGGSAGADLIIGGSGNDTLYGAGGDDIFQIGVSAGIDTIDGGDGIDRIVAAASNITISGLGVTGIEQISAAGFGGVRIGGGSGDDLLDFRTINLVGIVAIDANAGNDVIHGSKGDDTIVAGGGNDSLFGHDGNDTFQVGSGAGTDSFDGGAGYDRIVATNNNVSINPFGLTGIEEISANGLSGVSLLGDANANVLDFSGIALVGVAINGGSGNDVITGSSRDDLIVGGSGGDILTGGGGADIFDFNATSESRTTGVDRIIDFQQGFDRLDFSTIDASSKVSGNQAFTFIGSDAFSGVAGQLRFQTGPTSTSVFVDTDGNLSADMEVRLDGITQFSVTDFIL